MINKFLEYISVEKRYSAHTLTSYRKDLEDFSLFILEEEALEDLRKVDKKIIRNFIIKLSERNISKRSINRKLSTLRSFYTFLLKLSEIKASPMESISMLKFYAEKQIPFSQEEMQKLSKILAGEEVDCLERLILETLYQTGMRRAEICNLSLKNVHFSKKEIVVIGKGNKERVVPMSATLSQELEKYAQEIRQPNGESRDYFFVNAKGERLKESYIYIIVKKYMSQVSQKNKRSPHILRHSFATHILNNGAEISKVKKIMGHQSLASTQVYTNANIEQLKKVLNSAHPRMRK